MIDLTWKRPDGSFVAQVNGMPYHVVEGDEPLWSEAITAAKKLGANLKEGPAPESRPLTVQDYQFSIQAKVECVARGLGYNDDVTLASYVGSTVPGWAAEAQAFVAWRDSVWIYANEQLRLVEAGEREQPTVNDFILELPAFNWPPAPEPEV